MLLARLLLTTAGHRLKSMLLAKLLLTTTAFGLYNPRIIYADPSLMHRKED